MNLLIFLVVILIVVLIFTINNQDSYDTGFTRVRSSLPYPLSFIQSVRFGRKVFGPDLDDPILEWDQPNMQFTGPVSEGNVVFNKK